jgi:hypothetical protein
MIAIPRDAPGSVACGRSGSCHRSTGQLVTVDEGSMPRS